MQFNDLVAEKMVSLSIGQMLFGVDEIEQEDLEYSDLFPFKAYNIGLLYFVLVQAYMMSVAAKKGCSIKDLGYDETFVSTICSFWPVDKKGINITDSENKLWIFSFLKQCAKTEDLNIFNGLGTEIDPVQKAIERSNQSHFDVLLSEKQFADYIRALPLLANTEIDKECMCFVFKNTNIAEELRIDCRPFIFFRDTITEFRIDKWTQNCYVMSSIEKGKRKGQLSVRLKKLNDEDDCPKALPILWQVEKNESMRILFRILGISDNWLSMDECWCDFAFMKRLADAAENVLACHWGMDEGKKTGIDIRQKLIAIFEDAGICENISGIKGNASNEIYLKNIDKVLFGLFINFGIFKVIYNICYDCNNPVTGDNYFLKLFLDEFFSKGVITAEQRDLFLSESHKKIKKHLDALRKKLPYEDSAPFKLRSVEIEAEWSAYTILKAAGIKKDNLFLDKELIYSIDDYYDMIKSFDSSLAEDLTRVLLLLIQIYGPLFDNNLMQAMNHSKQELNNTKLNENQYYASLIDFREKYQGKSLEELFDVFVEINERSKNHPVIESILGRTAICSDVHLNYYRKRILEGILGYNANQKKSVYSTEKFVFISYSHKDNEDGKISALVEDWQNKGIGVRFDKREFGAGSDWIANAEGFIDDENCAAVVVFVSKNSAVSKQVCHEMIHAQRKIDKKFAGESKKAENFFIPVNLEEKTVGVYLEDLSHDLTGEKKRSARKISEILHSDLIFRNFSTDIESGLVEQDIVERIGDRGKLDFSVRTNVYDPFELDVANFYYFLKYGANTEDINYKDEAKIEKLFKGKGRISPTTENCVFPMVTSVKETKIHRDNITMVGYEILSESGEPNRFQTNYILTSSSLISPDDYYCIPHYERVGEDCSWMIDPLLVSHRKMMRGKNSSEE